MPFIIKNGKYYASAGSNDAGDIIYDNSESELSSTSVQGAITEIANDVSTFGTNLEELINDVNSSSASTDLLAEADVGINCRRIVRCTGNTLNTPYTEGLTKFQAGLGIVMVSSANYATIMYIPSGTRNIYMISKNDGTWGTWRDFGGEIDTLSDELNVLDKKFYTSKSNVNLNDIVTPGFYGVSNSDTSVDLNFPIGTNGILLVFQYGSTVGARGRQIFFRVGTIDSNDHHWYSRQFITSSGTLTFGAWEQIVTDKVLDAAVANYLPLSGGTLTGGQIYFNNGLGRVTADSSTMQMEHYGTAKDSNDRTVLSIHDSNALVNKLRLRTVIDGTSTYYQIYGTHSITASTSALTAGTSSLTTGCIHLTYS